MGKPRFNPNLLKVPLYIGGKSIEEVKEALGLDEVIKMASNESPVGPSPKAVEAARQALGQAHRYPGVADRDLRRKLAVHIGRGLTEENFVIGNGGTDVLRMITQAFLFDGGNTVMCEASFPMYHIFTATFGGEDKRVPPTPDYRHDLQAMADQIDDDTRVVFLCTPNNPTGHIITQAEADEFMARVPEHVVVVFDEAYSDFVSDEQYADSLRYVNDGHNVLILKSFSKSAGLANLRVGYAIGPAELTNYVRHAQLPFHSSAVSLAAASGSLDDAEYLARCRQAVRDGREFLCRAFDRLGLHYLPSQANFVTIVDTPLDPSELAEALLQKGFIVRAMAAFGLPNGLRVTVGAPDENKKFVAALGEVIGVP
ncbi:MAG: histidinol-phosphate transaminase [Anaerolineae bacterium]